MLLGLVGICAVIGLLRGFRVELYTLLVWVIGSGIGLIFCREFAEILSLFISQPVFKMAGAFISLLSITLVLGSLIGYLLGESLTQAGLFSRLMGFFVGGARGLLLIAVIVMLAGLTPLPTEPWWHEAQLIFPFQKLVLQLRDAIPSDLARYINYE
ncbi:MAG: CvpA family protein [Methylococcales bacterium]|nr:CvpA family protein [Methylococcales bacterium]